MVLVEFATWAQQFIAHFSYIAVFVVSVISSSTVIFPLPFEFLGIFIAAGLGLNPFLVAIVAGLGAATGELFGYFLGIGGRHVAEREKLRLKAPGYVKRFEKMFLKHGFWVIILAAFLPFPFDFIGILSGVSKYDIKKFFFSTLIGKTCKALILAFAGSVAVPYLMFMIGA